MRTVKIEVSSDMQAFNRVVSWADCIFTAHDTGADSPVEIAAELERIGYPTTASRVLECARNVGYSVPERGRA